METVMSTSKLTNHLILDSGASRHIIGANPIHLATDHCPILKTSLQVADGKTIRVSFVTDVSIPIIQEEEKINLKLHNALIIPECENSFISVTAMCDRGLRVAFSASHADVLRDREVIAKAKKCGKIYAFNIDKDEIGAPETLHMAHETRITMEWHDRLGHPGVKQMQKLLTAGTLPLQSIDIQAIQECTTC
jgi:hypothetical protein